MDYIKETVDVEAMNRLKSVIGKEQTLVKVQNEYHFDSEKNRTQIFHLRVLIKSLLSELEKVTSENGVKIELDEGVLGMIKAELFEGVDVEHIYELFRPLPKTVQVERIVEKVVPVTKILQQHKPVKISTVETLDNRIEVGVEIETEKMIRT